MQPVYVVDEFVSGAGVNLGGGGVSIVVSLGATAGGQSVREPSGVPKSISVRDDAVAVEVVGNGEPLVGVADFDQPVVVEVVVNR